MSVALAILMKLGTYAGVVSGAGLVLRGAEAVTRGTPVEPIVAGVGDTAMAFLDPLDIADHRKRRGRESIVSGFFFTPPKKNIVQTVQTKAIAEAQKRIAEADRKAAEADKRAAAADKRAAEARAKGEAPKANEAAFKAIQHRRWAQLARQTSARAREAVTTDASKALEIAQAAIELAKLAATPPASPQTALADPGASANSKSVFASLVDAINRTTSEPDFEELTDRVVESEPAAQRQEQVAMWDQFASGTALSEDDDDDDEGPEETAELDALMAQISGPAVVAGPLPGAAVAAAEGEDASEPEGETAGPCCTSCALAPGAGACSGGGKKVPSDAMIFGHANGSGLAKGSEWNGFISGPFDDDGDDDDDDDDFDTMLAGPVGLGRIDGRGYAGLEHGSDDAEEE